MASIKLKKKKNKIPAAQQQQINAIMQAASALHQSGKIDEAMRYYQEVLKISPHDPNALHLSALANYQTNQIDESLKLFKQALKYGAQIDDVWTNFSKIVSTLMRDNIDAELEPEILACFKRKDVQPQSLMIAAISVLKKKDDWRHLLTLSETNKSDEIKALAFTTAGLKQLNNPLFLSLLKETIISDPFFERLLIKLRSSFLHIWKEQPDYLLKPDVTQFLAHLATYNFVTEYVMLEPSEDTALLEQLSQDIDSTNVYQAGSVALAACYKPLHQYSFANSLSKAKDKPSLSNAKKLIQTQITEFEIEQNLKGTIQTIGSIQDDVSQKVRSQYEENPYPRWKSTFSSAGVSIARFISDVSPGFDTSLIESPAEPSILIAGCGTGKHAIETAYIYKNSKITAVDLSLSSLSYGKRKADELGLKNIEFIQADILELEQLNQQFDMVQSGGVLHHMHDPMAGWKVITSILKPGGTMNIGLYSELARQHVVASRDFIAERGYQSDLDGIRTCRAELMKLPEHHPAFRIVTGRDFYTSSNCRDLIFHVQEHRFTIPQIKSCINELGLNFIGFVNTDARLFEQYRSMFPDDSRMTNLDNWHQLEEKLPTTFAGMYQFWLYKPK